MAESKRWIVTTSGDRPLNDVARDIKAAGFVIDEVLDQIGIITGSATDSVAEADPGIFLASPMCHWMYPSTSDRQTPMRPGRDGLDSTIRQSSVTDHISADGSWPTRDQGSSLILNRQRSAAGSADT